MRAVGAEVCALKKSLSKEERLIIVDQCLEFNYKVYIVPLIADWKIKGDITKEKQSKLKILERKPIILDNKLISRQIKDQTILITGAAGSIGSEIVRQVLGFNLKTSLC
jgi:FlaA1/EpsC-like NDP-sugar epimerase